MRERDLRWLQRVAPSSFDPYRLHHREFHQGLAEYRRGLIDVIELLTKIALQSVSDLTH